MKKLLRIVEQVVKAFDVAGIKFTSSDNCEDDLTYEEVAEHTIVVGDDHERREWAVDLRVTSCPPGVSVCDVINVTLGPGTDTGRNDMSVLNWTPVKNVMVEGSRESVALFQRYTKH